MTRNRSKHAGEIREPSPSGPGESCLSPCASREEWEQLLASNQPDMRDLLVELACFADLWRYFEEHEQRLGPEVVRDIGGLHKLALAERIARLKGINRRLMRRINDAGESTRLRQ